MSRILSALAPWVRPITDFYLDPDNINDHPPEHVRELADSLEEFGQTKAVLCYADGRIACGNGTYEAALLLGWTEFAGMIDTDHTPEELARFAITDNKTPEGSALNQERLAAFVHTMRASNPLATLPGFKPEALAELALKFIHAGANGTETSILDPDDQSRRRTAAQTAPGALDLVPQRASLGQIWQLGDHRVMCGDSCNREHLSALLGPDRPVLVWADPPYGYRYESNYYAQGNPHGAILNDDVLLDFLPCLVPLCAGDCAFYTCAAHQNLHEWRQHLDTDLDYKNLLIWKKNNWGMGDLEGAYAGQYEAIFFHVQGRPLLQNGRDRDVWECDRVPPEFHPTQKPVPLIERAVKNSSQSGEVVFDPFAGSGPSLMACEANSRLWRGMELAPRYVDVMLEWWARYRGQEPILAQSLGG